MSFEYRLSTPNLTLAITMYSDRSIERLDEFITELFETVRDVPCQFRTHYIQVIIIMNIQQVHCVFGLEELARLSRIEVSYPQGVGTPQSLVLSETRRHLEPS
jgi:hypothetical protein